MRKKNSNFWGTIVLSDPRPHAHGSQIGSSWMFENSVKVNKCMNVSNSEILAGNGNVKV
jgi:hypothetical protein